MSTPIVTEEALDALSEESTAMDLAGAREWAGQMMLAHHPDHQSHGYDRCELCHFTHHPCDVFDLAAYVWRLSRRDSTAVARSPEGGTDAGR